MSPNKDGLTSSELAVLDSLHDCPKSSRSQREIARRTGFSVGLINAVIKRLVRTGYIKTGHLNRRSIEYILTPEGFAEKTRKSYRYVMNTVRNYRSIQLKLEDLLVKLCEEGAREFHLHGEGELAELVASVFEDSQKGTLKRGLPSRKNTKAVVLNALPVPVGDDNNWQVINLGRMLDVLGAAQK